MSLCSNCKGHEALTHSLTQSLDGSRRVSPGTDATCPDHCDNVTDSVFMVG